MAKTIDDIISDELSKRNYSKDGTKRPHKGLASTTRKGKGKYSYGGTKK